MLNKGSGCILFNFKKNLAIFIILTTNTINPVYTSEKIIICTKKKLNKTRVMIIYLSTRTVHVLLFIILALY